MTAFLAVAVDAPLRSTFDYRAPAGIPVDALKPGQRLWVPFGARRVVGMLIEIRTATSVPAGKLRTAHSLIDDEPILDATLLGLLTWASDYYRHPLGEVVAAALPKALREGAPASEIKTGYALSAAARVGELEPIGSRAHRLLELVELLSRRASATEAELAAWSGRWREHVRELEKRGWVTRLQQAPVTASRPVAAGPGPELVPAQREAVTAIGAATGTYAQFLLEGVTGSGKTEVYLRAIERVVANGSQALVLVPEIALTPQLVARFTSRFDAPLAVLHSGLTDLERLQAWRAAQNGSAPVVIGTRSAVFAPLARPGLIVVDEEHDASYKQQEGFRYSARDLALLRAQRSSTPIVLGSATPSLESLERVDQRKAIALRLPYRATGARAPEMRLVDLRRHATTQGIATPTLAALERHLAAGGQVLLYLNRRGYAPTLFCPACGWSAACERCDARLTVHQRERTLRCHHCGAETPIPDACRNCGEPAKPVGQGTERIEETLTALLPGVPLVRIDRDAVRRKGVLEHALASVRDGTARVLVGTQMLTKGHDFPDVSLVVVLNADQGLFGTDFRASERLAQTIVQVAGRAGRAERPGEVLIQTEYPEHPLLRQLVEGGYDAFATAALAERKAARWPPFARLAILRAEATRRELPQRFLELALGSAPAYGNDVELLGPAWAPMERRAGHYRAQLLVHAAAHGPLQRLLADWLPAIDALPEARKVRWSIDVDPLELF
jgi:primosomal protein N' (replication factor Y)